MPTAVAPTLDDATRDATYDASRVDAYLTAMQRAGRQTGRSTVQAAKTFCTKIEHSGGWDHMSAAQQIDAIEKARSFASWLLVTTQLTISGDLMGRLDLHLGHAARSHCPEALVWFTNACAVLNTTDADASLQWNALAKVTAVTGTPARQIDTTAFDAARTAITGAYVARGMANSGRNMASIFHRLQLTLFHAGSLNSHRQIPSKESVSITGWTAVAPGLAEVARRYVAQVDLSLAPSTVKHIEHDLREFGTQNS